MYPKFFFFFGSGPDPTLTLISDPDSAPDSNPDPDLACFYEKYIRNSDDLGIAKKPDRIRN